MDKKSLCETDICEKFISPALLRSGWDMIERSLRNQLADALAAVVVA